MLPWSRRCADKPEARACESGARAAAFVALESLRLQLFSRDIAGRFDRGCMLLRPLTRHLAAVVVVDRDGDSETTLRRADARRLHLADDALFALARRNAVAAADPYVRSFTIQTAAGDLDLRVSDVPYLGAHLLDALERRGEDALVAWVTWHHAVVHPIGAGTRVATLLEMQALVDKVQAEARCQPLAWLSPAIEFHDARRRVFTPVGVRRAAAGRRAEVTPPELAARLGG